MADIDEIIEQAISDFDGIKTAIEETGVAVPYGTDTSTYGDLIRKIGENGATFTPHINDNGDLWWTNDKNLKNPKTVNLKGTDGTNGTDGTDGISAYQIAVRNGYTGSESEWVASLKGEKGENGARGADGKSAYEVAVDNGYSGTASQWLRSFNGGVFCLENYAESFEAGYYFSDSLTPTEMTITLRNAITYASNWGFKVIKFPANQTITVGLDSTTGGNLGTSGDGGGVVITVPEKLVIDLNGCTIQIQANDYTKTKYQICKLRGDYSEIRNGTLIGDYAVPDSKHQWGHGVTVEGSYCKVENLKIQDFLGDGIYICSQTYGTISISDSSYWTADTTNGSIYTSLIDISSFIANGDTEMKVRIANDKTKTGAKWLPYCKIEFYDSNETLVSNARLKTQNSIMATDIMIPDNSKYVKVYIYSQDFNDETWCTDFISNFVNSYLRVMTSPCRGNLINNIIIKHIGRNGITLGKTNQTVISNFVISDVNGTAPKACIDVEEGRDEGYNCTIKNGWLTDSDFGIDFAANMGLTIESLLMGGFASHALYGIGSRQVSINNSIIVGTIECGNAGLSNNTIKNSTIVASIYAHNYDFNSCKIFANNIQVDGRCTIRDCYISVPYLEGTLKAVGIFENCFFDGNNRKVKILLEADMADRVDWANITTSFYNCRFKDLLRFKMTAYAHSNQSDYLMVDTISGCHITTYRLDGVTARQIINSTFDGMDYYNGSTYHTPIFKCGLISGCLFDRSLNESGKSISDNYKGVIRVLENGNNYVPEAIVIMNNRFIGLVTGSDYALTVTGATVPVYFNNNYGLRKTIGESTTVQLTAVQDSTNGAATIDSTNNYGFKT